MNITILVTEERVTNESPSLSISEMVDHICSQVDELDAPRRYMFMQWLLMHSCAVHCASQLRENLTVWLGSMSTQSAEWEYKLILGETRWWRHLEEIRLVGIMLEGIGKQS